jgi:hypothetical protein
MTTTLDRPKPAAVQGVTEPRIYTPPLEENLYHGEPFQQSDTGLWVFDGDLDPLHTHGYAAIKFATDMLHMALYPWQIWLLIHALELITDDNGNEVYRFRIAIVCAARQNGKSRVVIVLALWHLFAMHSRTVIGTAQDLSKADDTWKEAVGWAESDDELCELFDPSGIFMGHPKTFTLNDGCEYRVASATRRGGRGFSGDIILLDELREHQNWESWSAVTNTMNARPRGQAWAFSNAGDATSVVLRYQRALAHRDLEWPDGEREFDGVLDDIDPEIAAMLEEAGDLKPGWFEWSAPPSAKRGDINALAQANPSLNHSEVAIDCPTTRTLLSALASNPAYEYETEVMCRWATMGVGGPFPEGSWEDTLVSKDADGRIPEAGRATPQSKKVVCVEVSSRRGQTFIARAGLNADRVPVVGMRWDHPGTDWVVEKLVAEKDTTEAVVVRTEAGSPSMTLYEQLVRELPYMRIMEWPSADVDVAHGQMFDRLRDRRIKHLRHDGMDTAATTAVTVEKPGGAFRIDIKRSPTDVASIYAAIGALWGLESIIGNEYNVLDSLR